MVTRFHRQCTHFRGTLGLSNQLTMCHTQLKVTEWEYCRVFTGKWTHLLAPLYSFFRVANWTPRHKRAYNIFISLLIQLIWRKNLRTLATPVARVYPGVQMYSSVPCPSLCLAVAVSVFMLMWNTLWVDTLRGQHVSIRNALETCSLLCPCPTRHLRNWMPPFVTSAKIPCDSM